MLGLPGSGKRASMLLPGTGQFNEYRAAEFGLLQGRLRDFHPFRTIAALRRPPLSSAAGKRLIKLDILVARHGSTLVRASAPGENVCTRLLSVVENSIV